ncbi:hypothetical protein V5L88_001159 [Escherichia coli]
MVINVKIKCAYHLCNKETEQTKSVKSHLHFMKGTIPVTEERQYCSKQCAENDQMAHELYPLNLIFRQFSFMPDITAP